MSIINKQPLLSESTCLRPSAFYHRIFICKHFTCSWSQSHTHCHRKLLCSASPDGIVTVSPHGMCHHFLASHSALKCAYLCISLSFLPGRQTEAAREQEPIAFPLPLVLAPLIYMRWDEWNGTLLPRSTPQNCCVLNLSRKPQNIKCHLLLFSCSGHGTSLRWRCLNWFSLAETMTRSEVWVGRKKIVFKTVRNVSMSFSEVCEGDIFTPILFTQQAPSFYNKTKHGEAEPRG